MKEEKKESPIGVLWGWGKPYHGKFIWQATPNTARIILPMNFPMDADGLEKIRNYFIKGVSVK